MDNVVNAVEIGVIMSQRNTHAFDPHKQVEWTLSLTKRIKEQAGKGEFAIFGLGGPGMYIANEMGNQVAYIIDDDPTKQATEYCDIRIIPLKEADPKIDVFVAMNNPEASLIMRDKILSRREELCVIAL